MDSRVARARAAAKARFYDIFDPHYEPWEEVQDSSDQSDLEDADTNHLSHKGTSCFANDDHTFHVRESSRSSTMM